MDINTLVRLPVKTNMPKLAPGDTVKVTVKVIEGEKQRGQAFQGVVIRVRKGTNNASFTVRRVTHGIGVERTFMVHSPLVEKVEVIRHGDVRRARLFYLRGLSTKESRAKEKGRALSVEELAGAGAAVSAAPEAGAEPEGAAASSEVPAVNAEAASAPAAEAGVSEAK
ncbi:MAG: 50S ribosomal protein L19 [Chloroflexi bacterium]|nr:50S ribosomal protein L19 [Chloroflexota bacterium]